MSGFIFNCGYYMYYTVVTKSSSITMWWHNSIFKVRVNMHLATFAYSCIRVHMFHVVLWILYVYVYSSTCTVRLLIFDFFRSPKDSLAYWQQKVSLIMSGSGWKQRRAGESLVLPLGQLLFASFFLFLPRVELSKCTSMLDIQTKSIWRESCSLGNMYRYIRHTK